MHELYFRKDGIQVQLTLNSKYSYCSFLYDNLQHGSWYILLLATSYSYTSYTGQLMKIKCMPLCETQSSKEAHMC